MERVMRHRRRSRKRDADAGALPIYCAAGSAAEEAARQARRRRRRRAGQGGRAAEARQARQGAQGRDGRPRRRDRRGPRGERRGVRQELRPARRRVTGAPRGAAAGGAGLQVPGKYQGSSFTELLAVGSRTSAFPTSRALRRAIRGSRVPAGHDGARASSTPTASSSRAIASRRKGTASRRATSRRSTRPTQYSVIAIAGAAGPRDRDGATDADRARALREDRGRGARARRQGQQALADDPRRTCPRPCRAWSWCRSSPATTAAASTGGCGSST